MFKWVFIGFLCSVAWTIHAESNSFLVDAYNWIIWENREKIIHLKKEIGFDISPLSLQKKQSCERYYDQFYQRGHIDIIFSLGYMDVSSGENYFYKNINLGSDLVLDSIAKSSLTRLFLQPCVEGLKACEFSQISSKHLLKNLKRNDGTIVTVNLILADSSVTASDKKNRNQFFFEQQIKTKESQEIFFRGLQEGAEVVLYLGHARNGGGPDFSPPHLLPNGKPNYNYYRKNKIGITNVLSAMDEREKPTRLLGLLACQSYRWFAPAIIKKSPDTVVVSADDLFDYNDMIPTGFAIVEAILSETCGELFERIVKTRSSSSHHIKMSQPLGQ